VRLIQLQVFAVYLSSALGKLFDADWRSGQTMGVRFSRGLDTLALRGVELPSWLADVYGSELFASVASKGAIATELFIAVGLFLPRTRAIALYVGVLFHLGIELSARVELFSYVMGAAYVAFVVPETRARVIEVSSESRLGAFLSRALPLVDWLGRFRIEAGSTRSLSVIDRAGRRHAGLAAHAMLCRALPVLFPLWAPVALAASIGRTRRRDLT
jgi:hypothetical protein